MNAIELPYQPVEPRSYRPKIGLIGCGWVTEYHLKAYTHAGYNVAAMCDCNEAKAIERQKQFYPGATVYTDANQLLAREDIEVVDIATHPAWDDYRALALPSGLRACWSSPIVSSAGAVLGTFAMYFREARGPDERELHWVERATHIASIAIERAILEELAGKTSN